MGKVKIAVGVSTLACGAAGWWWRPIADPMNGDEKGPIRNGWMSKHLLSDHADQSKPILYELARRVTVFVTVTAARSFLIYGGEFKIKFDENYDKFLEKVLDRDSGIALITVSNHRSLADDTTVFSSVLPYWMNIQPRYLRYSLCAQEYCFNPKVGHVSFVIRLLCLCNHSLKSCVCHSFFYFYPLILTHLFLFYLSSFLLVSFPVL
jgi:hypothetical protein